MTTTLLLRPAVPAPRFPNEDKWTTTEQSLRDTTKEWDSGQQRENSAAVNTSEVSRASLVNVEICRL